jgi:hypothetical protein
MPTDTLRHTARASVRVSASLALIVALAACGVRTNGPDTAQTFATTAAADLAPAKRVFDVDAPVGSLAFAPSTQTVWLARNLANGAVLDAVKEGGLVSETRLPGGQLGGQSKVKLAPDGSVWVTDDYRLLRYDVASGVVTTISLDDHVLGEYPDAQNPNSPAPGTWVSAITFDQQGDAIVARHNVPKLFTFTPTLSPGATIDVGADAAGVAELAFDATGLHGLSGDIGAGDKEVPVAASSFTAAAPATDVNVMQGIRGDSTQVFAKGQGGLGASVSATKDGLTLTWGPSGAERSFAMPQQTFERLSPDGKTIVPVVTWTHPTVLLPTPDGGLWFVADNEGQALFRVS